MHADIRRWWLCNSWLQQHGGQGGADYPHADPAGLIVVGPAAGYTRISHLGSLHELQEHH